MLGDAPAPAAPARERTVSQEIEDTVIDGRYLLKRLRSSGGGADVYAATHRFTKRDVALKLPHPNNPKGAARVAREIEALSRVRAPGVVEMLDAGELGGGHFLVLELLEGRTLAGLLIARGKLGAEEVTKIGAALADALEVCHDSGVVHRDLRPGTVFVSRQPGREITLTDFGVAKVAGVDDAISSIAPVGSEDYSAPELLATPEAADHHADLFGLGATLYECLTGSIPHEPGAAAARAALGELRPDLPPALIAVVERATHREPAQRFASARELGDALRASTRVPMDSVRVLGQPRPKPESIPVSATAPSLAEPGASAATRRKFPRAPYSTLARVTGASGERIDGRLEEVSEGGLQFVGGQHVTVGQLVRIRFALPATGRIAETPGVSRWTRAGRGGHATGFELVDLAEDVRAELRQYVRIMGGE